jgi:hypothetical protein
MAADADVAVTLGNDITETVTTAGEFDTQLLVAVPVIEYTVVATGVTAASVVVLTELTEYVLAPVGNMLNVRPEQTEPLLALIVGEEITTTVDTAGDVMFETHPRELVPVTEKFAVAEGEITFVIVPLALDRVYVPPVPAPLGLSV